MSKTENVLHSSQRVPRRDNGIAPIAAPNVPRYSLYGDVGPDTWFVNVEPLEARARKSDWNIQPHAHPKFLQYVFVVDGDGTMVLDGRSSPFSGPAALVVPTARIHAIRYSAVARGWVLTADNLYVSDVVSRFPELRRTTDVGGAFALSPNALRAASVAMASLRKEQHGHESGRRIAAEAALLQVMLALMRGVVDATHRGERASVPLYDQFCALVEGSFRERPDLTELARRLNVTVTQLRMACKQAAGLSPSTVLQERLLAEARRCLLYSQTSVAAIGYSLGFESAAYFSRFFKQKSGVAPKEFRRAHT